MTYLLNKPWLLGLLLAIFLAAVMEVGRRAASYLHIHDDTNRKDQVFSIRDGLFLLMSLLLGFSVTLVVPRYTERRTLLVEEAVSRRPTSAPPRSPSRIAITPTTSYVNTSMPDSIWTALVSTRPVSTMRRIVPSTSRLTYGQTRLP
jgi:hypothetical protein